MHHNRVIGVGALTTIALALAGCSSASPQAAEPTGSIVNATQCGNDERTITDDLGELAISGTPERIVVAEYSFLDAVTLVGLEPVGVADDSNADSIIPEIRERFGDYESVGMRRSPNVPAILALEPDLVIIDSTRNADIYEQLADSVPTLALASQESDYAENIDSMTVIAQALNRCAEMQDVVDGHEALMADYATQMEVLGELPTFAFGVAADQSFYVHNGAGYVPSVLESLGMESAFPADPSAPQAEIGLESLMAAAPGALFVAEYTDPNVLGDWSGNTLFQTIPAVVDGRVFSVDPDVWARTRGLTASELIAEQAVEFLSGD